MFHLLIDQKTEIPPTIADELVVDFVTYRQDQSPAWSLDPGILASNVKPRSDPVMPAPSLLLPAALPWQSRLLLLPGSW